MTAPPPQRSWGGKRIWHSDAKCHAPRPGVDLRCSGRGYVRSAGAGPQPELGPVAAGQSQPLRTRLPGRLSHLRARHDLSRGTLVVGGIGRAGDVSDRRDAALAIRQVQGERTRVAPDHLQLRRHPRSGDPALLDRRLSPLRDALFDAVDQGGAVLHSRARADPVSRGRRAGLGHLALAAQDLCRQGTARECGGFRHRRGLRRRLQEARLPAVGHVRGLCWRGRHLHRLDRHLGAGRIVLRADRHPAVGSGVAMTTAQGLPKLVAALAIVAFALLPTAGLPAFYDSFFYLVFFWVSLSTSWALLSGFAGYFSLGHAAFFGVGMYTTATLTTKFGVPFLLTIPAAAAIPALLGVGIGAVVFRLRRLRGELFALLTLAVTFVIGTIILNTPIDGGGGVFMSAVPLPHLMSTPTGTIYILGFALCVLTLAIAWWVAHSRLGMGLFAIYDDEDVAEAKGVPTFRYKLLAIALSAGIAGAVGGIHAMYVGFLTVAGTFELTVPLYVVLMSVLGGSRHWLGPAVGATAITTLLYAFISGGEAMVGRAIVGLILILAILWLPDGVIPAIQHRLKRRRTAPVRILAEVVPVVPATIQPIGERHILEVRGVVKRFGGLEALAGVDLDVREGEIFGLVGPNGSGKTTLINVISGHYPLSSGTIAVDGVAIGSLAAHEIARRGVARTYQIPRPFVNMSVLDNVALAATFGGPVRTQAEIRDEAMHWIGFTGLGGKEQALPAELNLHERKFLELARALAARPKLLLLDEVLSGLNPSEIDNAIRLVRAIRAQRATIVFVEHLMRAVVELSDRIAVLNEGKLFALGAPREVMRDPRVVSIYLGKAYAA